MGIEPPVLVNDDDGRTFARRFGRQSQIALHLARGARIGDGFRLQPRVILGHEGGPRLVGFEQRHDGGGRRGAARQLRELAHEIATVEGQMSIFVVKTDHFL